MAGKVRTVERRVASMARRSHGVVTRAELFAAGITKAEIDGRLRTGSLIAVFRGVYRVGHKAPSVEARYVAAVKAAGDGALLSGLAAGWLWGLVKGQAPPAEVSARTQRRIKGVQTRRVRRLGRGTVWRGVPVTPVAATLLRLSSPSLLSFEALARAAHEAAVRYDITEVEGAPVRLRAILEGDAPILLSRLERGFRAHLRQRRWELPLTNRPAGAHYVDCRWPEYRLTVELDSYRFHRTRHAWERDRERERAARRRGDEFRRYSWRDVFEQPGQMLEELDDFLA